MNPSSFMHQYGNTANQLGSGQIPQGSKLATYINRPGFQPQQSYNATEYNKPSSGIAFESSSTKKFSATGICEFVPQPSQMALSSRPRISGSLRLPNTAGPGVGFSSEGIGGGALTTPPPSAMMGSPPQSPTPSSLSMMNASEVDPSSSNSNIAIFNEGGTTYFYSGDEMNMGETMNRVNGGRPASLVVPGYSVFTDSASHLAAAKSHKNTPGFMSQSDFKMEILKRQYVMLSQIDPDSASKPITEVENFHQLLPLEPPPASPHQKSHTFGYATSVYKATNIKNGLQFCLRRIHGFRLVHTKCMSLVDQWRKLQHSNVVNLKQVFTTKAFGDHSIVFIYDFYPGAETLMTKYFRNSDSQFKAFADHFSNTDGPRPYSQQKNQMLRQQAMLSQNGLLPESLLWNYIIQLTAGIRHIHSNGLACRTLDPTKILVFNSPNPRLLLSCCGIFDILNFDPTSSNPVAAIAHYQQEDLVALGKIVLALACNSCLAIQRENLQTSMEIVTATYSTDLRNFIMYLLTNPNRVKSINDLMPMIGARFYNQLDSAYRIQDSLEVELAKEVESSRLFRVLTKLCTVVDRAELNGDYSWSEYGDCYMLKLFRDYVFHQVMEDNRPWLDMAHIIANLNKLDAGLSDRICLMSRDEQNVLVVSYAELKRCLEQSFGECVQASRGSNAEGESSGGGRF